jgi:stalled ribosome rescue protein Dom34
MTNHVAVWIDHKQARVFHIGPDEVDEVTVTAPPHSIHDKRPRGSGGVKEHPDDAKRFFRDVTRALDGAHKILIVGPSSAKLELMKYVHDREHAIEARVVGVEVVDHPTDGQVVALARTYFRRTDGLRPMRAE